MTGPLENRYYEYDCQQSPSRSPTSSLRYRQFQGFSRLTPPGSLPLDPTGGKAPKPRLARARHELPFLSDCNTGRG